MKNRLLILIILIVSGLLVCACGVSFSVVRGSGDVETETREVSNFNRVSLSGFGNVIITQGETESLKIEAEDNILPRITTEVRGNTLYIGFEDDSWRRSIIPTEPVCFYLNVKDLEKIDISGAGDIEVESLETQELEIDMSGAGDVRIDNLTANSLDVNFSGAGRCELSGEVLNQKIRVSGLGDYDGADLKSQTGDVTLSGAGSVRIWTTEELDITVSGAGKVEYWGNPRVTQNVSGVGSINSRGER